LAWEALRGGDAIVRVHDVAATKQVVELSKYYKSVAYDKGR
jgi:dihydropteroate synthase